MGSSYRQIEKAWAEVKRTNAKNFENIAPSLGCMDDINISMTNRNIHDISVVFTGFSEAVADIDDIPMVKNSIISWLEHFAIVKKGQASNVDILELLISPFEETTEDSVNEAVIKVFKRKNNKIIPSLKCMGGPKHGKIVSDPSICATPVSIEKRQGAKKGQRNKASVKAKKRMSKITYIMSRRKLGKANKRLKNARGF